MVRDIPGVQGIREVGIGGSVSAMYDRYPEPATTFTVPVPPDKDPENRKNATVHVYPQRGVAFETYGSRIVAITLFPRQE